jgi:hypothetical protein
LPKNVSNGVGKIAAVLVAQHLASCEAVRVVDISGERASAAPSTSTLNSAKQIVEKVQRVRTRHATQTAEHDDADMAIAATAGQAALDALLRTRPVHAATPLCHK